MPGMAASTGNMTKSKTLSWLIYTLTTVIGIVAFLYPFWMPALQQGQMGMAHSKDAPLMLTALVGACIVLGTLGPLIVPALFYLIIRRRFIRIEESMLEEKFGDEYLEFKRSVRRWI